MKVFTYNEDARILAAKAVLENTEKEGVRVHLLPIPSKSFFADAAVSKAFFERLEPGDLVCGYGIPLAQCERIEQCGGTVFEEEADADFINENAILTAEATMGFLLSEARAPRDLTIGIVGYGRIGQALCRMLLFFGAHVRVFTQRAAVRATLGTVGIESRPIGYTEGEAPDLSGLDLLIQTAPAKIFTKDNAPAIPLWNLAAASYIGEGVAVRQLSALPSKIAYKSGGKALTHAVLRALQDNERKTL